MCSGGCNDERGNVSGEFSTPQTTEQTRLRMRPGFTVEPTWTSLAVGKSRPFPKELPGCCMGSVQQWCPLIRTRTPEARGSQDEPPPPRGHAPAVGGIEHPCAVEQLRAVDRRWGRPVNPRHGTGARSPCGGLCGRDHSDYNDSCVRHCNEGVHCEWVSPPPRKTPQLKYQCSTGGSSRRRAKEFIKQKAQGKVHSAGFYEGSFLPTMW